MDISSLAILPLLYFGNQIDFTIGDRLFWLRAVFAVAQLAVLAMLVIVRLKIDASPDGPIVRVPLTAAEKLKAGREDVSATSMLFGSDGKESKDPKDFRSLSQHEYDMEQWQELLKGTLMPAAILLAIHLKWGSTMPLFIQTFTTPMRIAQGHLVAEYLFGKIAPRPFPVAPGMLAAFRDKMEEATGAKDKRKAKKTKKSTGAHED